MNTKRKKANTSHTVRQKGDKKNKIQHKQLKYPEKRIAKKIKDSPQSKKLHQKQLKQKTPNHSSQSEGLKLSRSNSKSLQPSQPHMEKSEKKHKLSRVSPLANKLKRPFQAQKGLESAWAIMEDIKGSNHESSEEKVGWDNTIDRNMRKKSIKNIGKPILEKTKEFNEYNVHDMTSQLDDVESKTALQEAPSLTASSEYLEMQKEVSALQEEIAALLRGE